MGGLRHAHAAVGAIFLTLVVGGCSPRDVHGDNAPSSSPGGIDQKDESMLDGARGHGSIGLRIPASGDFGTVSQGVIPGRPYVTMDLPVCSDDASSGEIVSVLPKDPQGIRITDFGVVSPHDRFGGTLAPLSDYETVTRRLEEVPRCDTVAMLAIESVLEDGFSRGYFSGYYVVLESDAGVRRSTFVPGHILLCSGKPLEGSSDSCQG